MLSACGGPLTVDDTCDCGFYTINDRKMQWPLNSTVKYQFNKEVPVTERPSIVAAANTYNDLLANLSIDIDAQREEAPDFQGDHTVDNANKLSGDGVNGVYWLEEPWPWNESSPQSDAMTLVKFDGQGIVETDVYFRARSFKTRSQTQVTQSEVRPDPTTNVTFQPLSAPVDAQWIYVIGVHEFGHAVGRVHAHEDNSIMYKTVGLDSLSKPFTSYDRDVFATVYKLK